MTKKLTRSPDDKWIAGVCGGIAEYSGIDANVIRLIVAVGTVLGAGSLIIAYLVAWILMPKRPRGMIQGTATDVPPPTHPAPPQQ